MLAQQQLLDLIEAALLAATPAWAAGYSRQRSRPLPAGIDQAVVLRLTSGQCEQLYAGATAPVQWTTRIGIECMARAGASTGGDAAVAPLLLDVYARLLGASLTLQAAGYRLQPDIAIQWDQDDLDERIASAVILANITHRSPWDSLTATP